MSKEQKELIEKIEGQENFWGTQQYHKISLLPYVITDGAKHILEEGKCFWMFDEFYVMIHDQCMGKDTSLMICKIQVNENRSCKLIIEDGNYNKLAEKDLSYTSFPAKEQTIWASFSMIDGKNRLVFFLSGEY